MFIQIAMSHDSRYIKKTKIAYKNELNLSANKKLKEIAAMKNNR